MKATRGWGPCSCNCGEKIMPGSEFVIIEGAMYLSGHEQRRTRAIPVIPEEDTATETFPAKSKRKKNQP